MAAIFWAPTSAAAGRDDMTASDRLESIVVTGNCSLTAAIIGLSC
jgi:hypothetical protein